MSKEKIIHFLLIALLFTACGKKEEKSKDFLKKYDTRNIIGEWKLVPSRADKFIFHPNGKSYYIKDGISRDIFIFADSRGVRFQFLAEDEFPFAYFLFSEQKSKIWAGVLDEKVVRLEKNEPESKSILE
jgi:hypothetical protein